MESVILYLSNVLNYKDAVDDMKEYAKNKFGKKGEDIVL